MKTKELIRRLNELDPTGEIECSVSGHDVFFCESLPAYYDGCYQQLLRDDRKKPYYDIIGVRICGQGEKINLRTVSAEEFLLDEPDGLIQYDSEYARKHNEERIEQIRKENKEIIAEIDKEFDEKIEKDKQKILDNSKKHDTDLAKFIQDILTTGKKTSQTLYASGEPLSFNLPSVPDQRKKNASEKFSQIWKLLKEIIDLERE